ncbi:carbonic anhydrase [Bordetella petrii]|uniref:carbonic anhydrase n=1 Tax=Bordetella petrii TaxID=94624 RepID=UPI001E2A7A0A|nr:carbonic anhydrase [Bordetella petrii]MCD0501538.1 carbonic anhydrase [Bordetella petrii]
MPNTSTGDLQRFISGFQRFQQHYFDDAPGLFRNLCRGQNPGTLLNGCCDSRVDPALLLGCDPGDIFTVRNVANLVPLSEDLGGQQGVLAAIQFAVEQLQVGRIIVLGHSQCGGIRALMEQRLAGDGDREGDYIGRWVNIAGPAREQVLRQLPHASLAEQRRACEQASILISLRNLESFACVKRQMDRGALSLHGWYFDLNAGTLLAYSPRADAFLPMS